jgi:two-component system response regulator YesN
MRFLKRLLFQFHNNYYIKLVTVFFSIITASLLFLMFIFSWQQKEVNEREKLNFDLNSFSNFTQILEKKVLSDVDDVMFSGIVDILSFNAMSDYDLKNPFVYSDNPFDTTLNYKKRLDQLREVYPYITTIDIYSYKFDTYISSSTTTGGVFYNALKRKNDLENFIPYHVLDTLKTSDSGRIWISPTQNNVVERFIGKTSVVQRLPLFSSPSDNDVVIIINIDPEIIYNVYFKNQILYNSHFYIIDKDNNIILKTSSDEYLSTVLNKDRQSNEIKTQPTGTDKFTYDKAEFNIIWQTSSSNQWKYIYLSKKPSTLSQLTSSLRFVFTCFIMVFISCLVITLLVSKEIYRPIGALLKYTSSILKTSNDENKGDIEEITNVFTSLNNQLMHYKDTIDKNSSLLLNNVAISLLDGNVHDMEDLNSWLSVLNMKFDHNDFFFFIMKIDPEVYESLNNQKRDIFLLYIREHVESYYNSRNTNSLKLISCYRQDDVIPFIVNIDKQQYSMEKEAPSIILSNMSEEFSNCISISVSDIVSDLSEFKNEYKVVLTYFKYVFLYGNKNIFDKEKVDKLDSNSGIYDTALKKHFKSLLKLCKFDELKIEIAEFYAQAKQKNYSFLYLHALSAEIISMIINEFQNNDIPLPKSEDEHLMSSFSKLKSIEHCAQWYANLIDAYAEGIQNKSLNIDSQYMQSIFEYIDKDIINVTLNSTADKFKISTAHLSRMFKKQTGRNFSDYVTEKRLEHVCHLIVTTDMKISDIVSTMGYQNINYFNKIFKLQYNITPTQYRKQHQI